jgi:hypothetical protein
VSQFVVFLLLGLGSGAVFGALALALNLTYRSSGVIDFGEGSRLPGRLTDDHRPHRGPDGDQPGAQSRHLVRAAAR